MNRDEINNAIEYSFVGMYEQVDGMMNVYKNEGISAIQFPDIDNWEFNRSGMTRLSETNAQDTIKEILDFYKKQGSTSISWAIGPLTTPANFSEYLKKNKFEYKEAAWGMHLPVEADLEVHDLKGLEIRECDIKDLEKDDVIVMIEKAYGMPAGAGKLLAKFTELYQKKTKVAVYIGYDGDKPVAFANIVVIPGTKVALLAGAATLPEYRGKGIYSNMLKVRKDKAKELGIEDLVIQAKEETSAPIAKKHGFEKVCTLDFYMYHPNPN